MLDANDLPGTEGNEWVAQEDMRGTGRKMAEFPPARGEMWSTGRKMAVFLPTQEGM